MIDISADNLAVLEAAFKRKMKAGTKVTLTIENLGRIMQATRLDERASLVEKKLQEAIDILKD